MTTQADNEQQTAVPVSFRISTYWKRRRSEPGLTRMDSQRLLLSETLDWVLSELPEEAITVKHDLATDIVAIRIDWSRVPEAIRYGGRS
jgi:hypothetical protein